MDSKRENEVVTLLNEAKAKNEPFYQTKSQLLSKGFTEAEIVWALYSDPYDDKNVGPKSPNPLEKLYKESPEQASQVAKRMLLGHERDNLNVATTELITGSVGDTQTRNYYTYMGISRLGLPYFTLTLVGLIIVVLSIFMNWPSSTSKVVFGVYAIIVSIFIVYTIAKGYWRTHKQ